jgi:hypothetical protein
MCFVWEYVHGDGWGVERRRVRDFRALMATILDVYVSIYHT